MSCFSFHTKSRLRCRLQIMKTLAHPPLASQSSTHPLRHQAHYLILFIFLQFVEEDFIEMRSKSDDDNPVTADDLHRLLVLARLVSLSRGLDTLNKECWDITKRMEAERLRRVKNRVASGI